MNYTLLSHKKINFFLDNSCKKWFCLPEKDVFDFIDTLTDKNILFDLGACEGRFTVYAQKKNIKTYSFEPDKYNFNVLLNNININNLNNKNVYKIALSNKNEDLFLNKGQPWEGGHLKILENGDRLSTFKIKEREKVKCYRLDDFIKKNKLPYPTHMKIDIDGSELNFIKGADTTLTKCKEVYIELYTSQKEIIEILKKKYNFKIKEKNQIYSVKNNPYPNLFNYWFIK
jgi:FkbM family methyltransferase